VYVCFWKHSIAFGSQVRRFLVKHRQVTKRFPRAHLGSFGGLDQLRVVLHARRRRGADQVPFHQVFGQFVSHFEGLARQDGSVLASKLSISQ
jgi:hypothetical protein